jgi:hypothetical protein
MLSPFYSTYCTCFNMICVIRTSRISVLEPMAKPSHTQTNKEPGNPKDNFCKYSTNFCNLRMCNTSRSLKIIPPVSPFTFGCRYAWLHHVLQPTTRSSEVRQIPPRTPSIFRLAMFLCHVFSVVCPTCNYTKQNGQYMYNETLWGVRVMFIPPRLSGKPNTTSLEEGAFMAT